MTSFAVAMRRLIAQGYRPPEAMRAVWAAVRRGEVAPPPRPVERRAAQYVRAAMRATNPPRKGYRINPDGLGEAAVTIAARAARAYADRHGIALDVDRLVPVLRERLRVRLPEALADARRALEAGMPEVAEQTFAATIALAGVEAVQALVGRNPARRMAPWSRVVRESVPQWDPAVRSWPRGPLAEPSAGWWGPGPVVAVRRLTRRRVERPEFLRARRALELAMAELTGQLGPRGGLRRLPRGADPMMALEASSRVARRARVLGRLWRDLGVAYGAVARRNPLVGETDDLRFVVRSLDDLFAAGLRLVARDLRARGFAAVVEVYSRTSPAAFSAYLTPRGRLVYVAGSPALFRQVAPRWRALIAAVTAGGNPTRRYRVERVADPRAFDPRSFRTVVPAPGVRVTIGCPRGSWDARRQRCRVGTRAQRVLRANPVRTVDMLEDGRRVVRHVFYGRTPAEARAVERAHVRADASLRAALEGRPYRGVRIRAVRPNPVLIYPRIEAIAGRKTGPHAGRYVHHFRTPVAAWGLPDGSVRLVPR